MSEEDGKRGLESMVGRRLGSKADQGKKCGERQTREGTDSREEWNYIEQKERQQGQGQRQP